MSHAHEPVRYSNDTAEQAVTPLRNCCYAFLVINTLFVAGRLVSRLAIRKLPFWWDDFWVLPAYLCNIGVCALGLYMAQTMVHYDTPETGDIEIVNLAELRPLLECIYTIIQLILPGYALTRYSILALYLRIFSDKGVRSATWIVIVIITLQWISFAFASIFQCTPVAYFWDRTIPGGHCINIDAFYRSFTIPNIILDVVIIILPIPTVWSLKATRLRKWGLSLVFGIGTIALVASCIRLWIYELFSAETIAPKKTNALVSYLVVEPGIYLIAACLPAMHHLLAAMVPQFIQEWLEQKLVAFRHPISRGGRGPSPNDNSARAHPLYGDFTKLSDHNNSSSSKATGGGAGAGFAKAWRKGSGKRQKGDEYELEQGGRGLIPDGAIMVTTEVIITQEERIESVMGF